MLKLCIWMDVPSHYQSAFFKALARRDDVDLRVCYTKGVSDKRAAQGWKNEHHYVDYEQCFDGENDPDRILKKVPEWKGRVHVISAYISRTLIDRFCREKVAWCHWSEMPGIRFADALGYRMNVYRLLNPLMLKLKRKDARQMKEHALLAFGQGMLATGSFKMMGVPEKKLGHLYYVPEALEPMSPNQDLLKFANGRRIFLSVGALCRRKGVDVLLRAFSKLRTDDWCIVLCGLDRENGAHEKMAAALGLKDKVLFLGAYPVERIAEVYAASDVFILPSRFDGWGAVLNEACSLGLPLIGTDLCGGSWHVIEDGKNGFRVRADSVNSLKNAMEKMALHPKKLDDYGHHSRVLFDAEFSPNRNAERLVNQLETAGATHA